MASRIAIQPRCKYPFAAKWLERSRFSESPQMVWNAKLDWAEEVYTMLIVLPVPVLAVGLLAWFAPALYRRRLFAQNAAVAPDPDEVSGRTAAERT
jgi:hypothetical protein